MLQNVYASRDAFRKQLAKQSTDEDIVLDGILMAVSRQIDVHMHTHFFVKQDTRVYTAQDSDCVLVDDLLAVTTLKVDLASDLSYAQTMTTTDYRLSPPNAPRLSPPRPYWRIRTAPLASVSFLTIEEAVQVVGKFGFYEVLERKTSELTGAVNTSVKIIPVDDGTEFEAGNILLLESEQVTIQSIDNDNLSVTRAQNGTTAASHADNTPIDIYTFPIVDYACLVQSEHLYRSRNAPGGFMGDPLVGNLVRIPPLQPLVIAMLNPLRWRVAQ